MSRPYKVVLESVTQEKKKLRSIISYHEVAPSGFTFVPVGAPDLTEACKELSRQRGVDVHVVSAAPKNKAYIDPRNISHHIHRIGHHFRNDIVETACIKTGLRISRRGNREFRPHVQSNAIKQRLDQHGRLLGLTDAQDDPERQKAAIRAAIRDLFPHMPEVDQLAIVEQAFKEGTNRVGTQLQLTLPRRVQLAVVAHIRHTKTSYDALLREKGWMEARHAVEQACLDQIVHWRGEANNNAGGELEELFEEVIVLDDESESEAPSARDTSAEGVTDRRTSAELRNIHGDWKPDKESPEIISVRPLRLEPPPLLTQESLQRRVRDTRDRIRNMQSQAPSIQMSNLAHQNEYSHQVYQHLPPAQSPLSLAARPNDFLRPQKRQRSQIDGAEPGPPQRLRMLNTIPSSQSTAAYPWHSGAARGTHVAHHVSDLNSGQLALPAMQSKQSNQPLAQALIQRVPPPLIPPPPPPQLSNYFHQNIATNPYSQPEAATPRNIFARPGQSFAQQYNGISLDLSTTRGPGARNDLLDPSAPQPHWHIAPNEQGRPPWMYDVSIQHPLYYYKDGQ